MSTSSSMINGRQGQPIQGDPSRTRLHQIVQRYCRSVWKRELKIRAVSLGALKTKLSVTDMQYLSRLLLFNIVPPELDQCFGLYRQFLPM